MNWTMIFLIIVLLVGADKFITVMNIKAVQKHNPELNELTIEKNPLARWLFQQLGLIKGTIIYGILSIGTFYLALWLLHYPASLWSPENAYGVSFYILCLAYGFVITNNLYFLLRYNQLI